LRQAIDTTISTTTQKTTAAMGLVDYSDSESESETGQQKPTPATSAAPKKPFQKLLDRSSGAGKIVVNLPAASTAPDASAADEQPPAKRAKTSGGSRFSSLGSFLPPPKKTAATVPAASAKTPGTAPAPGVHLRTAAEPAFVRGVDNNSSDVDGDATNSLPSKGPSIPEGQKPEEEVKLVGKPLMFKPLSVARKKAPLKTKKKDTGPVAPGSALGASASRNGPPTATAAAVPSAEPPQKKKISLFSMNNDEPAPATAAPTGTYEPVFSSAPDPTALDQDEESDVTSAYPVYQPDPTPLDQNQQHDQTFSSLADTLSPAARRELFGRANPNGAAAHSSLLPPGAKVITFDMEREYAHNEALRASGAQQAYNPVRSIAPGKHSLRQVVNMAQSNQGALEESFARAKSNQRDAAGRYGW
jgi:hypothetical protein